MPKKLTAIPDRSALTALVAWLTAKDGQGKHDHHSGVVDDRFLA
jgi:hypothetical protein